jgi:N-acetylmuramoyl-L-alanine amidase
MIEAGFLTHPVERRLATSSAYHDQLAALIVSAAAAFLAGSP